MTSEDAMAGKDESATGIKAEPLMDLFSPKNRTILITGKWSASKTSCLTI